MESTNSKRMENILFFAEIISTFYRELIDRGVPEYVACSLALGFQASHLEHFFIEMNRGGTVENDFADLINNIRGDMH